MKMLRLLAATFILAVVTSLPYGPTLDLDSDWELFKITYSKVYTPEEELVRRVIWEDNLKRIQQHNVEADLGLHSYTMGINHLADMTSSEVVRMLNGYKTPENRSGGYTYLPPNNVGNLPSEVDWRTKGYVTPVKDQESCQSCWAFSATGSLEGQHFRKTGKLVSLSEQNLVDCSRKQGNTGCQGGLMTYAFQYVKENNGIDTEASYPYKDQDEKCHFKRADVGATDTGFINIKSGSEADLQAAVAHVGPVSVGIDAHLDSFHNYNKGIYYDQHCSSTKLDHGVLVVGYGSFGKGQDYWIVKNSWGETWGDKGYILMARNRDNNCGIATDASYPTV